MTATSSRGHGHGHGRRGLLQSAEQARGYGIRAAWIGLAGMAATAVLQMAIVAVSGSVASLADTLHDVGHAITTIPLVITFGWGGGRRTTATATATGAPRTSSAC